MLVLCVFSTFSLSTRCSTLVGSSTHCSTLVGSVGISVGTSVGTSVGYRREVRRVIRVTRGIQPRAIKKIKKKPSNCSYRVIQGKFFFFFFSYLCWGFQMNNIWLYIKGDSGNFYFGYLLSKVYSVIFFLKLKKIN